MRKLVAISVCIATMMCGCVRKQTNLYPVAVNLPNGAPGAVVYCRQKSHCFRLATWVCHGPYSILQKDDSPANDFVTNPPQQLEESEYIIQCNPPPTPTVMEEASR